MPLLKTTLLTGARPGEISRLRWADVTHGYAGQRPLLLPDLIREQEKITQFMTERG